MAVFKFVIGTTDVTPNLSSSVTVTADRGMSRTTAHQTLIANFGDGYEQRFLSGINTKDDTFSVTFSNRSAADINLIADCLDEKAAKNFTFTVTDRVGDTNLKVVCDTYTTTYVREDFHTLNATFRRVYEP